ncbi:hypothetical protein BH09ACT7_BH09ACT7_14480 [soil metagenome]
MAPGHVEMLGQQTDHGVVGFPVDGAFGYIDRQGTVVVDLDQRALAAARFDPDRDRLRQQATTTEEPWPKRPWLAVMPTFAPST